MTTATSSTSVAREMTPAREMMPAVALAELARSYGVQTRYRDNAGGQPRASAGVLVAALRSLGAEVESPADAPEALARRRQELDARLVEPVVVAWGGRLAGVPVRSGDGGAAPSATLELEDGDVWRVDAGVDRATGTATTLWSAERLPYGYHTLHVSAGRREATATVISAPRRTWRPATSRQRRGLFAPLYALRSERSMGAGNLGDLGELAAWASALGVDVIGTLPLLAAFLDEPCEPSPYVPVSRRMWNELYLDVAAALAADGRMTDLDGDVAATVERLRREPFVDHRTQAALQRAVVESQLQAAGDDARKARAEFLDEHPDVDDYARFRAAGERHGTDWRRWPHAMASGTIGAGDVDQRAVDYHVDAQRLVAAQVDELTRTMRRSGITLYLDLPLGSHALGWDAWRCRRELVDGLSVGAPPDLLHAGGQNWGFAPLHPDGSRTNGHRYFRACVAHHARAAGVMRIDHVMGLHRLFCFPHGYDEGVYIRQPADELWAIICVESHRHECEMVGENLGTVPADVNRALRRHALAGMWVAVFDPFGTPEAGWLACLDTHDTPTFAGWWRACDAATRRRLVDRLCRDAGLAVDPHVGENGADGVAEREVLAAMLRLLGSSDASISLVALEDLWLETARQNVPGTTIEHPNWRRRMRHDLETITTDPTIAATLRNLVMLDDAQGGGDR